MHEIIQAAPYFIPIIIVVYFAGIACGIKLAGWAIKNRHAGKQRIKKMESE